MQSISFKMQYTATFTAILSALDLPTTELVRFHIPHTTILEYVCVMKESYKTLLELQDTKDTGLEFTQKPFEQVELLLRLLLSAGGDTVITPKLGVFCKSVDDVFSDIVVEKNIKNLFQQIEWLITRIGAIFVIDTMKSLKIE
jgi:hypothetical protein